MTLDSTLLREAGQARDRVIELQLEADRAQVNYQHAIRRLYAAGGSLREIADALGLSHQRVHQIVETVPGKVAFKESRGFCNCTFCGSGKEEALKVIAGPGVFICDRCITLAIDVTLKGEPTANERTWLTLALNRRTRCSFCGKKPTKSLHVVEGQGFPADRASPRKYVGPGVRICEECLGVCNDIIFEQVDRV